MLVKQDEKCTICGGSWNLVVDHSHSTGKVRGLLCRICNRNVGWLEKFDTIIKDYLEENGDVYN